VRFAVRILGKEVILFDQPVHLEPVVEAVLLAAVVRTGMRSFLNRRRLLDKGRHSRLRGRSLASVFYKWPSEQHKTGGRCCDGSHNSRPSADSHRPLKQWRLFSNPL
jgi:hypothetical protein